jgi:hypothetical protein
LHLAVKTRPNSIERSIFSAPFGTVLSSVEILLDVALTIGPNERKRRKGLVSIGGFYRISKAKIGM